jgi:hypothetical protein
VKNRRTILLIIIVLDLILRIEILINSILRVIRTKQYIKEIIMIMIKEITKVNLIHKG